MHETQIYMKLKAKIAKLAAILMYSLSIESLCKMIWNNASLDAKCLLSCENIPKCMIMNETGMWRPTFLRGEAMHELVKTPINMHACCQCSCESVSYHFIVSYTLLCYYSLLLMQKPWHGRRSLCQVPFLHLECRQQCRLSTTTSTCLEASVTVLGGSMTSSCLTQVHHVNTDAQSNLYL